MQSKYSKRNILWAVPILLIVALYFYFKPATNQQQYIDVAKAYMVPNTEDITFEQSFRNICTEDEWTFFETNRGQKVVEFSGECQLGEQQPVNLQFLLDDDNETELGALLINHEVVNEEDKSVYYEQFAAQ